MELCALMLQTRGAVDIDDMDDYRMAIALTRMNRRDEP